MALVVVRAPFGNSRSQWQDRLGPVECLNLAFLIDTQHHGFDRRIDIQSPMMSRSFSTAAVGGEFPEAVPHRAVSKSKSKSMLPVVSNLDNSTRVETVLENEVSQWHAVGRDFRVKRDSVLRRCLRQAHGLPFLSIFGASTVFSMVWLSPSRIWLLNHHTPPFLMAQSALFSDSNNAAILPRWG